MNVSVIERRCRCGRRTFDTSGRCDRCADIADMRQLGDSADQKESAS